VEEDNECLPILEIAVPAERLGRGAVDVCRRLREGTPRCFVGHGGLAAGKLLINPLHLTDATAAQLATRLREELTPAR
jgi:L-seryl-tRNA(Ser) seleniumtransferase